MSAFYWGDDDTAAPYPPPGMLCRVQRCSTGAALPASLRETIGGG